MPLLPLFAHVSASQCNCLSTCPIVCSVLSRAATHCAVAASAQCCSSSSAMCKQQLHLGAGLALVDQQCSFAQHHSNSSAPISHWSGDAAPPRPRFEDFAAAVKQHPEVLTARMNVYGNDERGMSQLLQEFDEQINPVHIANAFRHLSRQSKKGQLQLNSPAAQQLLAHLNHKVAQLLPQFGQRELANTMHACHVLEQKQTVELLMETFMQPDMLQQADTMSLTAALHVGRREGILSNEQLRQLQALVKPADIMQTAAQLYEAAKNGKFVLDQQWQGKLQAVCRRADRAGVRALTQVLYAAAKLGKSVTDDQLKQLVAALFASQGTLSAADPATLSSALWALGTLGVSSIPVEHLQQLLASFVDTFASGTHFVAAHHISTALWAAVVLDQQVQVTNDAAAQRTHGQHTPLLTKRQLKQLASALTKCLGTAQAKAVAQSLQAFVHFRFLPLQMLQDSQVAPALLDSLGAPTEPPAPVRLQAHGWSSQIVPAALFDMNTQQAADIAEALGYMGQPGAPLLYAVLRFAHERAKQGRKFTAQQASRLCWAAAAGGLETQAAKPSSGVTNQPDCADIVRDLARCCSSHWQDTTADDMFRLWQVHLWLHDRQPQEVQQAVQQEMQQPAVPRRRRRNAAEELATAAQQAPVSNAGLQGVLTEQQLEQCRSKYLQDLQAQGMDQEGAKLHSAVLSTLHHLPAECWQVPPAAGGLTVDGMFRVGIAAVTANGRQVAIEPVTSQQAFRVGSEKAGSKEFLISGPTQLKLDALAARGYEVIPISTFEWSAEHAVANGAFHSMLQREDVPKAAKSKVISLGKKPLRHMKLAKYLAQRLKLDFHISLL